MVKFLQIDTAANGNMIAPLKDLIFIDAFSTTQVRFVYSNAYQDLNQIKLDHAADANADEEVGSMVDALRKIVIDVAKGRWSTPVVNITSLLPKPITNIIID
jgi:hypothetical protein